MRKFLWAVLFASILAALPLIYLRVSNENNNKAVIIAGRLADYSNYSEEDSTDSSPYPEKLKAAGLSAVIIEENEFSLEDGTSGIRIHEVEQFHKNGLEIIIRLQSLKHSDKFYKQLAYAIESYNVKYILVYPTLQGNGSNTRTAKEAGVDTSSLKEIIARYNLTVFIMENKEQNGFSDVPGLKSLILETEYRINRAFSISNSIIAKTNNENAVYTWLRAVIDRNIRMVVVSSSDFSDSVTEASLVSIKRMQTMLVQRCFVIGSSLTPLYTSLPGTASKIPIYINLFAALALYLLYLFRMPVPAKLCFPGTVKHRAPAAYAITLFFLTLAAFILVYIKGDIGTAFISALVYPSLSSLLILRYLNKRKDINSSSIKTYGIPLLILLLTCYTGAAVVISSMSDIRYMMHLKNYNLVNPAYILPLLAFVLNFIICREIPLRLNRFSGINLKNIMAYAICTLALFAVLFLYTERSGNSLLLPASTLELEARKLLEIVFYARPRIKEFLIGYPALLLFIYFYKKNTSNSLLFISGLLSSMTGISILNSFCHGFTPAAVSLARSVGGLLTGIPLGLCVILAAAWLQKKRHSL